MPYALSHHYETCGVSLTTPFMLPFTLQGEETAEVEVRFAEVAESLSDPLVRRVRFETAPGQFLLIVDQVARFLVEDGTDIQIDPVPGHHVNELQHFLSTSVLAALLHQRRTLLLRGAALEREGRATLLLGAPGTGKSTLARGLQGRGWNLLSDEMIALDTQESTAWVMPEGPHLRLWPDSIKHLGVDQASHAIRPNLRKRLVHSPENVQFDDCPLKRIFILCPGENEAPTMLPLTGANRFKALKEETYCGYYLEGMGELGSHLLNLGALMQVVPHTEQLSFKQDFAGFERLLDFFEEAQT